MSKKNDAQYKMTLLLESLVQSSDHTIHTTHRAAKLRLTAVDLTAIAYGSSVLANSHPYPLYLELLVNGAHANTSLLPATQDAGYWTDGGAYSDDETDGQFARRKGAMQRFIPIQPSTLDHSKPSGYRLFDVLVAEDILLKEGEAITTTLHWREPDSVGALSEIKPLTFGFRYTVSLSYD